jgi:AhpD family alkylhydroperoxidase
MPHIALPDGVPGINAGLTYRPETAKPLLGLAQALLSDDNTLSRGDRELIAAYVSSLNECQFCQASHSAFAPRSACTTGTSTVLAPGSRTTWRCTWSGRR